MIPLFDLHADTLSSMYKNKELLSKNNLHISYEKAEFFSPYLQVMAIWSDFRLNNEEAYKNFFKVLSYARENGCKFTTRKDELNDRTLILAVEDARLLSNDIERLNVLYQNGVRVLTLNWKGESIIGGAWDTERGLSLFGKNVLKRAFSLGIIPDISHSSVKSAYEAVELASAYSKPIIASHSNSYGVFNHKRNLSDELFAEIKMLGGVVGISLAPEHLGESADVRTVINHIFHYLNLGGENTVCLGCDFDGVSSLPYGISSIFDLKILYFELIKEFGQEIADKIFYKNAYSFFQKSF